MQLVIELTAGEQAAIEATAATHGNTVEGVLSEVEVLFHSLLDSLPQETGAKPADPAGTTVFRLISGKEQEQETAAKKREALWEAQKAQEAERRREADEKHRKDVEEGRVIVYTLHEKSSEPTPPEKYILVGQHAPVRKRSGSSALQRRMDRARRYNQPSAEPAEQP